MDDHELPPPLRSENDAADHLDAVLALEDIVDGCLALILCDLRDDHLQPLATVLLGEPPGDVSPETVCDRWLSALASHGAIPPVAVFGRARPGRSYVLDEDRAWHEAMVAACREHGLTLEAAFVVTQHAVIPFPGALTEQSA